MMHNIRIRVSLVFFILCFCYLIILFNLFLIQVWNTRFFSSLAEQQYHSTVTKLPPRASIVDRTGVHFLAMNKECVSAFIMPNRLQKPEKLISFLKDHFSFSLDRFEKKRSSSFMYIKRRLSTEEQRVIQEAQLSDIHLLCESSRFYPLPSAAPLIGFTDIDNHGSAGIELSCEQQLAGKPAKYALEKDARSGFFYFKKELFEQGEQGSKVQLTIDSDLQFLVDEELASALKKYNAKQAAAIIMDPTTGDILAMSSHPYAEVSHPETINLEDTKQRVVTESYELGSVIKVFAALAALEEGVVTPTELIDCKNAKTAYIDGRKINTVKAHGVIPFSDVVAYSNNIGIAQVAKRLDTSLYDHYIKMGFGKKTEIPLPAERAGFVNHPSNWSKQSIISLSYGYEISSTLLQLATAFCMIAQDGYKVQPRLIYNTETSTKPLRLYSKESIDVIKSILKQATEHGTSWRARIKGYDVMSKTGTANILENGIYNDKKHRYTGAGIIEKGSYRRVLVTFIKEVDVPNAFASTIAVPILRSIAEKMIIHERAV